VIIFTTTNNETGLYFMKTLRIFMGDDIFSTGESSLIVSCEGRIQQ